MPGNILILHMDFGKRVPYNIFARKHEGMKIAMTQDEMLFFDGHPAALLLYERLKGRILAEVPDARIEVRKTQISFFTKHMFAAASFTPVRKAKERPKSFLTVTFGLRDRVSSPRIDAAVEPYPGRWTHHVMIGSVEEVDAELIGWMREAAAFSSGKR